MEENGARAAIGRTDKVNVDTSCITREKVRDPVLKRARASVIENDGKAIPVVVRGKEVSVSGVNVGKTTKVAV